MMKNLSRYEQQEASDKVTVYLVIHSILAWKRMSQKMMREYLILSRYKYSGLSFIAFAFTVTREMSTGDELDEIRVDFKDVKH